MKHIAIRTKISIVRTKTTRPVLYISTLLLGLSIQCAHAEDVVKNSYYVQRKSYGTLIETEPPKYVKQLNKTWLKDYKGLEDISWLDIGLDYRFRYEYRDNDFRRAKDVIDEPFLIRTRGYVGIKNILDPLRFAVEVGDARRSHSQFTREFDTRDINYAEVIQAYLEFFSNESPFGQDDLGNERPISIKFGRQALEQVDKRLLARNGNRNTTNSFQGLRVTIGQQENDWRLEAFAFNPMQRFINQSDARNDSQKFYGVMADWQKWSDVVTLQPYYYLFEQDGSKVKYNLNGREETYSSRKIDRTIHSAGLRAYGVIGKTGWDYDTNYVNQWGSQDASLTNKTSIGHDAYAYSAEIGYSFAQAWKPRVSAFYGLATGDKKSTDKKSQRFERLFGSSRPWSNGDSFEMSNIRTAKVRVELDPKIAFISNLKIDTGYSWYHLESDTDTWGPASLIDRTGRSGDRIGEEFDITARFPINKFVNTSIGYAHFWAGDYTKHATQLVANSNDPTRRNDSDYLYVQLEVSIF